MKLEPIEKNHFFLCLFVLAAVFLYSNVYPKASFFGALCGMMFMMGHLRIFALISRGLLLNESSPLGMLLLVTAKTILMLCQVLMMSSRGHDFALWSITGIGTLLLSALWYGQQESKADKTPREGEGKDGTDH